MSPLICSYKILQSSDYDDTRLITGENLCRQRSKKLAHLSLKHISLLGVVRAKMKPKKNKKKNNITKKKVEESKNRRQPNEFVFDEAFEYDEEEEEEDEEDEEEDLVDDDDETEIREGQILERGLSESEEDTDSSCANNSDDEVDSDNDKDEVGGDLSEQIVRRAEVAAAASSDAELLTTEGEHNYAVSPRHQPRAVFKVPTFRANWRKKKNSLQIFFLVLDGGERCRKAN